MLQRRHWDLDIGAPVTDRALVLVGVLVGAEVLEGASGRALDGVEAMGEASVGAELTLHGEACSVMSCWSRSYVAMILYAIRKKN
jgi:hypothetical protein